MAGVDTIKPLLRGWSHALAALGALVVTIGMLAQTQDDRVRFLSLLIFGICMIQLYVVSAVYHITPYDARHSRLLRALDHANIFLVIAGTYTPICINVLTGRLRIFVLALIWSLALAGALCSVLTMHLPRWISTALYLGMGWVALIPLPQLVGVLPWQAIATLLTGGALYTIGAVVYALRWPNPLPRVFGFHEIFHLFVIGGSAAFVMAIWLWVVPFQRV